MVTNKKAVKPPEVLHGLAFLIRLDQRWKILPVRLHHQLLSDNLISFLFM
jgi:hypothetical protein